MRFEFNRTGAERKELVQAMGEILEVKPRYLGMPTVAYQVDYFHIDKNGGVEPAGAACGEGDYCSPGRNGAGRRHGGRKR